MEELLIRKEVTCPKHEEYPTGSEIWSCLLQCFPNDRLYNTHSNSDQHSVESTASILENNETATLNICLPYSVVLTFLARLLN